MEAPMSSIRCLIFYTLPLRSIVSESHGIHVSSSLEEQRFMCPLGVVSRRDATSCQHQHPLAAYLSDPCSVLLLQTPLRHGTFV